MTVLYVKGTQMADKGISKPLIKPFLVALGCLFLLTMHYFQPHPAGTGLALPSNAMSWIPLSLALGVGLLEISRQRIWRYSRLTVVLLISCLLLTLPLAYPQANPVQALPRLLGLWSGMLLFIALQQFAFNLKQRQALLWMLLIAIWMQAVWGWVQLILQSPFSPFASLADLSLNPAGIFPNNTTMASFLATGLALSAYLLARIPMYRGKWSWRQLFLLLTPVVTIPLLVILSSKTGWLAAVIASCLMLPYLRHFAARAQGRMWFLMVMLGLSIALHIGTQIEWTPPDDSQTLAGLPVSHLSQAVAMLENQPLTGYGYGTFTTNYLLQTAQWHQLDPSQPAGLPTLHHPHNELLFWAVEGGIVPLLGIFLATAAVLFKVKKARHGTRLALLGLFFPIVLHIQLEYPFYYSLVHWITFVILIYWVDNLTAKYHKTPLKHIVPIRVSAWILPLIVTTFMTTSLYSGQLLSRFENNPEGNIDLLLKVNNPWAWQNRYEWDLYQAQLQIGMANDNDQLVNEFIHWANIKAKTWTRPKLYRQLIVAYTFIDKPELAEQVRLEAIYLFPLEDFTPAKDGAHKPLAR
ncbi:ligase [Photobacterium aquae]|uniref:Ligase n=1 Tax=Photobacterium aquae TaxID=1195763 RepID=A0A0J1JV32_9GAMM|nr:Wzy polymerase domain-containing protein [Photobacterium aquae]KLV06147.1 ligase [Photobacterium aquae]